MTTERKINGTYTGASIHWVGDGFRVSNYFPSGNDFGSRISPYILMDHHPVYSHPATDNERRGVGPHPHRGFETVSLAFEGSVAHHDSLGNAGVIGPGDAQWMTAASGILHREYHEKAYAKAGGPMHFAQIWVDLPKAHKMDPPRYQDLVADQMGLVTLADGAGIVRVVAGEFQGTKGPAKTFSPINLYDIRLNPQGQVDLSFPARENTALLVLDGSVTINGKVTAKTRDFVLFENEGEDITVVAGARSHLLLLNGEPLDQPVVQYGPFVMTSIEEVNQAITDFNSGTFGELAD